MPVKKKVAKKNVTKKTVANKPTQQKMVDFNTAITRFWTKYAEINGTAQRSEYWFAVLFVLLVNFVFSLFARVPFVGFLYWVWSIAIFIPGLTLTARRLHDVGLSAKWLLAFWLGILLGFVFMLMGYFSVLFVFLAEVSWVVSGIVGIFLVIISLLPSKFKDNPYRK